MKCRELQLTTNSRCP
ncbi:hypothetical protein QQP08_021870 [Theobroma cacao]|nr:hypothetical protein QQP08_021870 [Theobroma cacao]